MPATVEEEWEIQSNDFLKGDHSPEQVSVELINIECQKDGRWCDGHRILENLKKAKLTPIGLSFSVEEFSSEWHGKEIAVLGTRYLQKSDCSTILAVRLYYWSFAKKTWQYRMKRMDSEFGIRVQRNENLRVPVFKILT